MFDATLADHPAIVVLAYAAAFLPWSAVSATDFINARWKTVQTTLREGCIQLFLIILPSFYILFYIYLQALSGDYKEMSAAFVALFFSALHMARTLLGLAHVIAFRNWAVNSILAMQCMGVEYKSVDGPDKKDKENAKYAANRLLINDSLVDNTFVNTESASGIVYAPPQKCGHSKSSVYPSMIHRVRTLLSLSLVPFRFLFDRIAFALGLRKAPLPTLRVEPGNPVEVFINWASAFAAQGLSEWICEFRVAKNLESKMKDERSHLKELFQQRRDYFAAEVLSSAALRVKGGKTGSLMLWNEWNTDSDITDGRVTKEQLLQYVLETGVGLPYEVPHDKALGEDSTLGYGGYASKLTRVVESLPAGFGKEISNFDVEMLEWFAVFLCIGTQILERKRASEKEQKKEYNSSEEEEDDISSCESIENKPARHYEELERGDLAIENLEIQLGFARGCLSRVAKPLEDISMRMAVPMPYQHMMFVSSTNRLFLEVGEFIDIWLALLSAEQVDFLLSKDESWLERCLGKNIGMTMDTFVNRASNDKNETFAEGGEQKVLRQVHAELKMASMEFQFAKMKQRYWHLEQTLTFMGYDMEYVRSELAGWVGRKPGQHDDNWKPRISFDTRFNFMMTQSVLVGDLSAGFVDELMRSDLLVYLQRRSVHVQLIWEVRALLQQKLSESEGGPSCLVAMILCILAFPSLSMKVHPLSQHEKASYVHSIGDSLLPVVMRVKPPGTNETTEKSLEAYEVSVEPRCGPQSLYIRLRFQPWKENVKVTAFLARHFETEDDVFRWDWWRDAFSGRLEGLVEWKRNHRYPTSEVRSANGSISGGIRTIDVKMRGTGDKLRVWSGWLPFRVNMCRAEVSDSSFLMEYHEGQERTLTYKSLLDGDEWTINIPRQERAGVSYSAARRERLRHACDVIEEVIDENGNVSNSVGAMEAMSTEDQAEQVLAYANKLIAEESGYLDRALFMLEIAAYELGSTAALRRSVEVFLSGKDSIRDLADVVGLIQRCAYSMLTFACQTKQNDAVRPCIADKAAEIHSIQAMIMKDDTYGHDAVLIQKFTTWIDVMLSGNMNFDGYYWIARLRCSFVLSRNFDLLATLGEISLWRNIVRDGVTIVNPRRREVNHLILNKPSATWNILRVALYERAAYEGEIARAMFNLANILRDGIAGVAPNTGKAIALYQKCVNDCDFTPAMISLGVLLSDRNMPQYNAPAAVRLYQRAIYKEANADAMFNLANLLRSGGKGVVADACTAVKLYTRAVGQGHTASMVNMANLFYTGEHVTKDDEQAMALLRRAVKEGGNAVAMYNLALILLSSETVVPSNTVLARELLESASQQGHILAQICLGDMLCNGREGVMKDTLRAAELYQRAANGGNEEAMFRLGNLFRDGYEGVERDPERAKALYERIVTRGGELAEPALASLELLPRAERGGER